MPGTFEDSARDANTSLGGPDITTHIHAEADLFDFDIAMSSNEPDDTEVAQMLQPHLLLDSAWTSFEPIPDVSGAGKLSLVRKRSIEDDGSDLHGRDRESTPAVNNVSSESSFG